MWDPVLWKRLLHKEGRFLTFINYWPFFKISFESGDTCHTVYCATAYFRKKALSQIFDWVLNTLLSSAVAHEERGLV